MIETLYGAIMIRPAKAVFAALFFAVLTAIPGNLAASTGNTSYTITITEEQPRIAVIEAVVVADQGFLWMNDDGDQGLPHGWSTFVRGLEVRDADNKVLETVYEPLSRWRLVDRQADTKDEASPLTLRYEVLLQHDRFPLNFGDNGAAYMRDDAVMWSGRALFIVGQASRDIELTLRIPGDWKATTPWNRIEGEAGRYTVATTDDLVNSAFMVGAHREQTVRQGPLELRLALSGPQVSAAEEVFAGELGKYLEYYDSTIGHAPRRNMIVIAADSTYWGGEVMGRAISLSVAGEISGPNPMLAHIFAHEIVHLWGLDINFAAEDEEELYWFYEGMLAEYLSFLANVRLGDISQDEFLAQLGENFAKYQAAAEPGLSMSTAGHQKAAHYDLIYSGGMMAGAALDLVVRDSSGNKSGLEDLIRTLYVEYPKATGSRAKPGVRTLDSDAISQVAAETFDPEIGARLRAWVDGSTPIPFVAVASAAGIRVAPDEGSESADELLIHTETPTAQQQSIFDSIVKGR